MRLPSTNSLDGSDLGSPWLIESPLYVLPNEILVYSVLEHINTI